MGMSHGVAMGADTQQKAGGCLVPPHTAAVGFWLQRIPIFSLFAAAGSRVISGSAVGVDLYVVELC